MVLQVLENARLSIPCLCSFLNVDRFPRLQSLGLLCVTHFVNCAVRSCGGCLCGWQSVTELEVLCNHSWWCLSGMPGDWSIYLRGSRTEVFLRIFLSAFWQAFLARKLFHKACTVQQSMGFCECYTCRIHCWLTLPFSIDGAWKETLPSWPWLLSWVLHSSFTFFFLMRVCSVCLHSASWKHYCLM